MNDEEELIYFWETDDIWDNDGDLKILSLMWMCAECFNKAIFTCSEFLECIEEISKEKSLYRIICVF